MRPSSARRRPRRCASRCLPPTDTDQGVTAYTATFDNAAFKTQVKTETDIPALNSLDKLILPAGLTTIDEEAFMGLPCECVIVPEGVTSIGPRAFASCEQLIYVKLPSELSDIAADTFEDCPQARLDDGRQ